MLCLCCKLKYMPRWCVCLCIGTRGKGVILQSANPARKFDVYCKDKNGKNCPHVTLSHIHRRCNWLLLKIWIKIWYWKHWTAKWDINTRITNTPQLRWRSGPAFKMHSLICFYSVWQKLTECFNKLRIDVLFERNEAGVHNPWKPTGLSIEV